MPFSKIITRPEGGMNRVLTRTRHQFNRRGQAVTEIGPTLERSS